MNISVEMLKKNLCSIVGMVSYIFPMLILYSLPIFRLLSPVLSGWISIMTVKVYWCHILHEVNCSCTTCRSCMSRGVALLFLDHGTRRGGWSASRPGRSLPPGKDPVPIVQGAGLAPGPVWTGAANFVPIGIRSPDRPARSQSLYRLSYRDHTLYEVNAQ